jgi:hypothetical protein
LGRLDAGFGELRSAETGIPLPTDAALAGAVGLGEFPDADEVRFTGVVCDVPGGGWRLFPGLDMISEVKLCTQKHGHEHEHGESEKGKGKREEMKKLKIKIKKRREK